METRELFGCMYLGADATRVLDADEEIFLLYSDIQTYSQSSTAQQKFRGLGHVDSRQSILNIDIELTRPNYESELLGRRGRASRKASRVVKSHPKTLSFKIAQDVTALRSRNGDTGSVVWTASVDFARLILQQLHYGSLTESLFNKDLLSEMNVLELGAGTGVLSMALHTWFKAYSLTDVAPLLPLLSKNLSLNLPTTSNVSIHELDWNSLFSASTSMRKHLYDFPPADLILAVDCVYHPSLMPAFMETIDYLAETGRTTVLIVTELREESAVQAMLELWLKKERWQIWRMGRSNGLPRPYVIWAARKTIE